MLIRRADASDVDTWIMFKLKVDAYLKIQQINQTAKMVSTSVGKEQNHER